VRTGRLWPKLLCALAFGACPLTTAVTSRAQVPIGGRTETTRSGEADARSHFDRSLELYRAGRYAEALDQLQQAAKLDPDGKDLFFNLALVHEKLGQLPEAIAALERFRELETDAAERERARLSIERLRGAAHTAVATPPSAACAETSPAVAAPPEKAPNAVLIGAASVAVVSFVVGAVFGAKALSDDVSGARTSASLSVTELHQRGQRAEREALVADVAFALGAASTATFAGVWLLSPADPAKRAAGFTLRSYF
jgi:tetratricopeptide (TPR) repeat protein